VKFSLGHAQKSQLGQQSDLRLYAFGFLNLFFRLSLFSFSYLLAAVIDLLLGLLPVQFPRKNGKVLM